MRTGTDAFSFRVRPLSGKEIKAGEDMAVQFPGDGQIYVSYPSCFNVLTLAGLITC